MPDTSTSRPALEDRILQATSKTGAKSTLGSSYFDSRVAQVALATTFGLLGLALWSSSPGTDASGMPRFAAEAGVIPHAALEDDRESLLFSRDNSPTDVCTRWAHQSAIVNGTIYVYGGQATTQAGQTQNTWNNDFLSIDVTKSWQIASPSLRGLPQPSGPPAVSLGTLWGSFTSLFLYGGEYSWQPVVSPSPFSLWEYDIVGSAWKQHSNPQASDGTNSDKGGQPIQNAAEGAGIAVPELGRAFYFGGHLDGYTTAGWSQSIARVYLKSLLEFTFPGQINTDISSLKGQSSGSDGAWRNITQGGLQDTNGFPERADGALVYVPGFGKQGLLLGLAGGTNTTLNELNVIDVYDVANSTWYKQSTSGTSPKIRANPCAVAASAPDGSSINIYMYGGQNLQPAGDQIQYDDMWILSVPSFTWIKVDASSGNPPARAGHTCHLWDGQMIVVGGYVGKDISCDSPGIYVFNTTSLQWANQFTALAGSDAKNHQAAQKDSPSGLVGSYDYEVPAAVYSVIGGNGFGGATLTAPAASAVSGPLATGTPIEYSVPGVQTSAYVTVSDGHTITATGVFGPTAAATANSGANFDSKGSNDGSNGSNSGARIGAIVAGVVAGVLLIVIVYLAICLFIYRRQLKLYKNHVAVAQRATDNAGSSNHRASNEKTAFLGAGPLTGTHTSTHSEGASTHQDRRATSSGRGSSGRASIERWNLQNSEVPPVPTNRPDLLYRQASSNASSEDLLLSNEPTFFGVMLHPRRSLKIVNK